MNDDENCYVMVHMTGPFGKKLMDMSALMRLSEAAMTAGQLKMATNKGMMPHITKIEVVQLKKGI